MNRKEQIRVNNTLRKFDYISRGHVNCIRLRKCNSSEDYLHERIKIAKCYELFLDGISFLTEAKVLDEGMVADIVDLDNNLVIEIPISEGKDSLDRKELICKKAGLNFEILSKSQLVGKVL